MGELVYSDPAGVAWVYGSQFHGHRVCGYNECSHNRWEPRAEGEHRGRFVCALRNPALGEQDAGGGPGRICNSFDPVRQHKRYEVDLATQRRRRESDYSTWSGYESVDSWGVSPWD